MSKTVLADVEGFTPLIDILVKQYNGVITAAVFGRVWRYCQGPYGECRASLQTIANEIGLSYATALRHIKTLCNDGYLEDKTPDLRNRPHTYADTGKVGLQVLLKAGLSESKSGLSESKSHSIRETDEDTIREKKETTQETTRELPKQKNKQTAKDFLDLAAVTAEKQQQLRAPIKYLESIALAALGMKKAPNYRYDALWFEPLTDILEQAEGDIERAEEAIRASAAAAEADALTITSPRSLHGLALQELAARGNGQTPRQSMDALPNAAEDPAYLAWLSKQEGEANVSRP